MDFDRPGFDKEVGLRLQLARKRLRLTQGELAAEIGITRASYANIEAGRQRIPVDIVWRAAVRLGVALASLVPESIVSRGPGDHYSVQDPAASIPYVIASSVKPTTT